MPKVAERERWFWWHWQNLNEDRVTKRNGSGFWHGRAWFHFGRAVWRVSWDFTSTFCHTYLKVGGCENDFTIVLAVPKAALWFGVEDLVPYKWLPRNWSRETGFHIHNGGLWAYLWHDDNANNQGPWSWYRLSKLHFDPADFFLGRQKYSKETISVERVEIPMPEGAYPATVELFESTWKRPRWPWAKHMVRAEVTPDKPIPFPGKGENSWDCGMDGLYSLTTPADTVPKAIAATVESVMETRRKRHWTLDMIKAG